MFFFSFGCGDVALCDVTAGGFSGKSTDQEFTMQEGASMLGRFHVLCSCCLGTYM